MRFDQADCVRPKEDRRAGWSCLSARAKGRHTSKRPTGQTMHFGSSGQFLRVFIRLAIFSLFVVCNQPGPFVVKKTINNQSLLPSGTGRTLCVSLVQCLRDTIDARPSCNCPPDLALGSTAYSTGLFPRFPRGLKGNIQFFNGLKIVRAEPPPHPRSHPTSMSGCRSSVFGVTLKSNALHFCSIPPRSCFQPYQNLDPAATRGPVYEPPLWYPRNATYQVSCGYHTAVALCMSRLRAMEEQINGKCHTKKRHMINATIKKLLLQTQTGTTGA